MTSARSVRRAGPAFALAVAALLTGCTTAATQTGSATASPGAVTTPASRSPASEPPSPSPASGSVAPSASGSASPGGAKPGPPTPIEDPKALPIEITIASGQVTPNGQKIEVSSGQRVNLIVTSDIDDEIHAHDGGDGYELAVSAGETVSGSLVASEPGSFEIESHELGKTIVILNVR